MGDGSIIRQGIRNQHLYVRQHNQLDTYVQFSQHGLLGSQYECPNMVEMPMENATDPMYLMYSSMNPGAHLEGAFRKTFRGTFSGTRFMAVDGAARIVDFGKDHYAGQFFYGIPGDQPQVSIDWTSNWEYANCVPTGPVGGWQSESTTLANDRKYLQWCCLAFLHTTIALRMALC
jgi:sucrose-6-phosphate hydrolase SacC (GH32 family)